MDRRLAKRLPRCLAAAAALAIGLVPFSAGPRAAFAQEQGCGFSLGFQALRTMIPGVVGDCLENEHFEVATGNSLQRTTGGLLVWRKADNWTAFTDGMTTWINGPEGLASRPNAGPLFAWESPAPPVVQQTVPVEPPAPAPTPAPQPAVAATAPGPIQRSPTDFVLNVNDVGKEITQILSNSGPSDRARWAEARFERGDELFKSNLGPLQIYSKAYVADDVPAARAIYDREVERQRQLPEATTRKEGFFTPEDVVKIGDEQNSIAFCNYDCGTSEKFDSLHQRTVFRAQNVVGVLYFFGRDTDADVDQLNEWLRVLGGRIG